MKRFTAGILIAAVLTGIMMLAGFRTSSSRLKDQYREREEAHSVILDHALAYIETRPRYKSRYYAGGYPDDGFGTCTDVVGFALLRSGYDLRTKVNEDILAHPERYDIDVPDIDIDFRRVKNLIVYFRENEDVLTNDIYDIHAWQAGDLVIFRNHIGVISDHRNRNGVPYVIHHTGPLQLRYEEDILEKRDDLVLHVRIDLMGEGNGENSGNSHSGTDGSTETEHP